MASSTFVLALVVWIISIIQAAQPKWPLNLKRCSIDDPHLNECLMKLTQQGILTASKGMPAIGFKSLDPLRNASFNLITKSGPVVANIYSNDVEIIGPSKVQLRKVEFNKRTSTYWIEGYHPLLRMTGKYIVKGSVLAFPIDSKGTYELEMRGGLANHSMKLSDDKRDVSHGAVTFNLKTVKNMKINLKDSLLGEQGSNALNRIVNHNWDLISRVLWDPMEDSIRQIYTEALRPLTRKFSKEDFFPVLKTGQSNK